MHDSTIYSSTAYLLLVVGMDTNIKSIILSGSKNPCLRKDEVSSVLLEAKGKDWWEAQRAVREDLNRRADLFPLWAWFKHKLG